LTDSWLLRDLAEKIEAADSSKKRAPHIPTESPPYAGIVEGALEEALRVLGRSGADTIETLMTQRYGLYREDIVSKPGTYMSVMKDLLDAGCEVLERIMLSEIRKETGIEAGSVEEAVFKLKRFYSPSPGV
jgi:hypothetical protein